MTKEEAIKKLQEFAPLVVDDTREAIGMAIETLQAKTDGDLISRADAIEAVCDGCVWYKTASCEEGKEEWECSEVTKIRHLPSAEAEWIPVSERLPREYAQYLVCFEDGECYVYWLEDSDWAKGMAEKEGIIAWMPLPEPYKEDGDTK